MSAENIINELEKREENLSNIKEIVSCLEYIYNRLPIEIEHLTSEEKTDYLYEIMDLKINQLLTIINIYTNIKLNQDINYRIDDITSFYGKAGYDEATDSIILSIINLLLEEQTPTNNIQTIFHEFSHKIQHNFYKEENIEEILKYEPYYIGIAKEYALIKNIKDFYLDNYELLYTEIDADYKGLEYTKELLKIIQEEYPLTKELKQRIDNLIKTIHKDCGKIEKDLKQQKRLKEDYIKELYTEKTPTKKYYLDEDSLIYTNKFLSSNSKVQEQIPILKILYKDNRLKNYIEIQQDRNNLLEKYPTKEKEINKLYDYIIKTDPLLLLSKYLYTNDEVSLLKLLEEHKTLLKEYSEEIKELITTYSPNDNIINILERQKVLIMIQ